MRNSDYVYMSVCKLYDLYKQNPNLKVCCFIETKFNIYKGNFSFDENFVISENSVVLKDAIGYTSPKDSANFYNEVIIDIKAINTFSYKIETK